MNCPKIIKTVRWVSMNKDVSMVVERYIYFDCVLKLNEQYRKKIIVQDWDNTIKYRSHNDMLLAYNFRRFENGQWQSSMIYDIYFRRVSYLSENY